MARGIEGVVALDMSKFFDTNYHYMVPELDSASTPQPNWSKFIEKVRCLPLFASMLPCATTYAALPAMCQPALGCAIASLSSGVCFQGCLIVAGQARSEGNRQGGSHSNYHRCVASLPVI